MGGEEHHEHHHLSENADADFKMGLTSFAYIVGFMSVLYLTNYRDKDMRKYTYGTISNTISIFIAVLSYQGVDGLVEHFLKSGLGEEACEEPSVAIGSKVAVALACWFLLAYLLASGARLVGEPKKRTNFTYAEGDPRRAAEEETHFNYHKRDIRNKMNSCLVLAHMTGFANIGMWGEVQQKFFNKTPTSACFVCLLSIASFWVFLAVTAYLSRLLVDHLNPKEGGTKYQVECNKMFMPLFKDGENDAVGLGVSFPLASALRFLIGGKLPNAEGEEEPDELQEHNGTQVFYLFVVALAFAAVLMLPSLLAKKKEEAEEENETKYEEYESDSEAEEEEEEEKGGAIAVITSKLTDWDRLLEVVMTTCGLTFVLLLYYTTQWTLVVTGVIEHLNIHKKGIDEPLLDIMCAVGASFVGFLAILILDNIADSDTTAPATDKAIRKLIGAIGVLVGFAWEQSFDAEMVPINKVLMKGIWGRCLVIAALIYVVAPAWVKFIIPMKVEHGYRFGLVARKISQRARYGFEAEEEYKGDIARLCGWAIRIRTLSAVIPDGQQGLSKRYVQRLIDLLKDRVGNA